MGGRRIIAAVVGSSVFVALALAAAWILLTDVPDERDPRLFTTLASEHGLRVTVVSRLGYESPEADEFGEILTVTPPPGSVVLKGTEVKLALDGRDFRDDRLKVPDVVGLDARTALDRLSEADLSADVHGWFSAPWGAFMPSDPVAETAYFYVFAQDPVATSSPVAPVASRVRLDLVAFHEHAPSSLQYRRIDTSSRWFALHGAVVMRRGADWCSACHGATCSSRSVPCHRPPYSLLPTTPAGD